jgi:FAD/FMN-containing dehydrogenase
VPSPTLSVAGVSRHFPAYTTSPAIVNDVHSQLNPTAVADVVVPRRIADVRTTLATAAAMGRSVCVAGGRHAMGGQQFVQGGVILDMRGMKRVLDIDLSNGHVTVEAGIQWPDLIARLHEIQANVPGQWSIAQKQTGADRLTLGGALAANIHGRGLTMKPIIGDVVDFEIITPDGDRKLCSRQRNADLFRLAVGGYGLFGVITRVTLQLSRRRKLERCVELANVTELPALFAQRIADGFVYGDFQFAIDGESPDFLDRGIFSCYRPCDPDRSIPPAQRVLTEDGWRKLLYLAHHDKAKAFERYGAHYLGTHGQLYWSDTHQLSTYLDDYHRELDGRVSAPCRGTEMISELYVPRSRLVDFMERTREDLRSRRANCIYSTVRLIERDDESFLAWAREPWACVIFNLHADHTPSGLRHAADAFRALIDHAIACGGSYYLTYHRYARPSQVLACYPQFPRFLELKRYYDPDELLQSDWYRHYSRLFERVAA